MANLSNIKRAQEILYKINEGTPSYSYSMLKCNSVMMKMGETPIDPNLIINNESRSRRGITGHRPTKLMNILYDTMSGKGRTINDLRTLDDKKWLFRNGYIRPKYKRDVQGNVVMERSKDPKTGEEGDYHPVLEKIIDPVTGEMQPDYEFTDYAIQSYNHYLPEYTKLLVARENAKKQGMPFRGELNDDYYADDQSRSVKQQIVADILAKKPYKIIENGDIVTRYPGDEMYMLPYVHEVRSGGLEGMKGNWKRMMGIARMKGGVPDVYPNMDEKVPSGGSRAVEFFEDNIDPRTGKPHVGYEDGKPAGNMRSAEVQEFPDERFTSKDSKLKNGTVKPKGSPTSKFEPVLANAAQYAPPTAVEGKEYQRKGPLVGGNVLWNTKTTEMPFLTEDPEGLGLDEFDPNEMVRGTINEKGEPIANEGVSALHMPIDIDEAGRQTLQHLLKKGYIRKVYNKDPRVRPQYMWTLDGVRAANHSAREYASYVGNMYKEGKLSKEQYERTMLETTGRGEHPNTANRFKTFNDVNTDVPKFVDRTPIVGDDWKKDYLDNLYIQPRMENGEVDYGMTLLDDEDEPVPNWKIKADADARELWGEGNWIRDPNLINMRLKAGILPAGMMRTHDFNDDPTKGDIKGAEYVYYPHSGESTVEYIPYEGNKRGGAYPVIDTTKLTNTEPVTYHKDEQKQKRLKPLSNTEGLDI